MRKALCKIDKIIILSKNVEKTSALYSEALGLKVNLQSSDFVELIDQNNFIIYLKAVKSPSFLTKGYSPMISFKVQIQLKKGSKF
jgi:hypothetical protein